MYYEQSAYENRPFNRDPREQQSQANKANGPMYPRKKSYGVWLLLALLLGLLLVGGGLFSARNFSQQQSFADRIFAVTGHSQLTVSNGSGIVYVHAGATDHIIVHSTKIVSGFGVSLDDIHTDYVQNGNILNISSHEDNNFVLAGTREVNFDITVPTTTDLTLHTGSGQVHIADINGQTSGSTGSGDIEASNISGQTSVSTGSGDIEASNISGQATFSTGSGAIQVNQARLTGQSSLHTGSGEISLVGSLDPHGSYSFETGSGSVQLTLPGNAAFQLKAKTGSGTLHNNFGSDRAGSSPYAALSIKTGSGDIELDKQ